MTDEMRELGGMFLPQAAAMVALASLGIEVESEPRVYRQRAVVTHTHTEKPLSKRQKRRQRGKEQP